MTNREWVEWFKDYLYEQRRLSYNTAKNYLMDLRQFVQWLGNKSVQEVDNSDIERYIGYLSKQGLKPTSINRKIASLKHFYKALAKRKAVQENPTSDLETQKAPEKMPRWLTEEETAAMLKVADRKLRDRLLIKLMAYSGLRVSEVLNLRVCDVDFDTGYVLVYGKGSKERRVPVTPDTLNDLAAWIEAKELKDYDYLFHITPRNVQVMVKNYADAAGIKKHVTPHVLRHTFATRFVFSGTHIRVIQELLGHRSIETTRRYMHISDALVRREYEKVMCMK